jgi:hypothetical protein
MALLLDGAAFRADLVGPTGRVATFIVDLLAVGTLER